MASLSSAASKLGKKGLKEIQKLIDEYTSRGGDIKKIPTGKRTLTEAQMKKKVREEGKLIPPSDRLKGEEVAARPSYLKRPAGKRRTQTSPQKGLSGEQRGLAAEPKGKVKLKRKKAKKPKVKKPNDAAAKQFMRDKPVAGMGTNMRRPKSKIMKLQQDYEALTPSYKRAERAKGKQSIYYPVFKKLGMAKGGPIIKKRHGGMSHVGLSPAKEARAGTMSQADRLRRRATGGSTKGSKPISTTGSYGGKKQLASWTSGLSADQIREILGITTRDPKTGIRSKLKTPKKKKKVIKAQYGGKVVSKRNGGMTRVGLSPAEEARAGTLSEAARRRPRVPTPVRPAPRAQVPVRPAPILQPPVPQMAPPRPMKKGGYLKDIKPNTTWEQFKKKHPDVGITKESFKKLKPPTGLEWKKGPKYRRTYGGLELVEREAKRGGKVGKKKRKGKRISSKQTDGNKVVASLYD